MRILFIGVALLSKLFTHGQSISIAALLDSGKMEFRPLLQADYADYTRAYQLFEQAVRLDSTSAEAHYFLGYVLEKINLKFGMDSVGRELTEQASKEFETVNRLQPYYSGEMLLLDPYSKITASWGCLALNYLEEGKRDSAIWAFKEGRKRGGFLDALLHLGKSYLQSCKPNSILISNGDIVSFPLHYLQEVEGIRPDVLVMDANMFSTDWFPIYLRKQKGLIISFSDEELHQMALYREWKPTAIRVKNPKRPQVQMQWVVTPSFGDRYLHRQSEVLLDVFKQNLYGRPICFTDVPDTFSGLSLHEYFVPAGMVTEVATTKRSGAYALSLQNLQGYSLGNLTRENVLLSPDAFQALSNFRSCYMMIVVELYNNRRPKEAAALLKLMDTKFPESRLPFYNEKVKDMYRKLGQILKQ